MPLRLFALPRLNSISPCSMNVLVILLISPNPSCLFYLCAFAVSVSISLPVPSIFISFLFDRSSISLRCFLRLSVHFCPFLDLPLISFPSCPNKHKNKQTNRSAMRLATIPSFAWKRCTRGWRGLWGIENCYSMLMVVIVVAAVVAAGS